MRGRSNILFYKSRLTDVFRNQLQKATDSVNAIPEDTFRNSTDDEIIDHMFSELEIIPLELHDENKQMTRDEIDLDVTGDPSRLGPIMGGPAVVPGVRIAVEIPFTGDPGLWDCNPSVFSTAMPHADVHKDRTDEYKGHIVISLVRPVDRIGDGEQVKNELHGTIAKIKEYIEKIRTAVDGHHLDLRNRIAMSVEQRHERLGKQTELDKIIGIPLKRRPGTPDFKELPVKRRIVQPLKQKPDLPPEPGINSEVYELILDAIRHQGCTFETTRETYSDLEEEDLRNIILANLNQYFQGDATGETFRKSGKTDIRIEDNDRMAFIGECKVWSGPKGIQGDIDQLLGYSTWRDCKTALVYFNKTVAGFKSIQDKMEPALSDHPNYINPIPIDKAGEWRFKIRSTEDTGREITVHVFLFDLYVKKAKLEKTND